MAQLISRQDEQYKKYEDLLIRKDSLLKDAGSIRVAWIREFGALINRSFEAKIECIRLKKEIAFCRQSVNRGEKVDLTAMAEYISGVMAEYEEQLHDMLRETRSAMSAQRTDTATLIEVKHLYRKLAKKIHPDLYSHTADDPELMELWQRLTSAYHANALKEIRELEVLIEKAIASHGGERDTVDIPDLPERIADLEDEIEKITTTPPYIYNDILSDPKRVEVRRNELKEEIESFESYRKELDQYLTGLIDSHGEGPKWPLS
jgi:hypothetical protein